MGEPVIHGGLPARHHLQPALHGERFQSVQDVERQRGYPGLGGLELVEAAVMASRPDGTPALSTAGFGDAVVGNRYTWHTTTNCHFGTTTSCR
jgi:hypothetical protein